MSMPAPAYREPELVTAIKRLAELEGAAFLAPSQGAELTRLRRELSERWPEVAAALADAYLQIAAR